MTADHRARSAHEDQPRGTRLRSPRAARSCSRSLLAADRRGGLRRARRGQLAPATWPGPSATLLRAFETQLAGAGFSFVEILTMCPTGWFVETDEAPGVPRRHARRGAHPRCAEGPAGRVNGPSPQEGPVMAVHGGKVGDAILVGLRGIDCPGRSSSRRVDRRGRRQAEVLVTLNDDARRDRGRARRRDPMGPRPRRRCRRLPARRACRQDG